MIDIVNNPESIIYGTKSKINLYQLFHKVTNLFNSKLNYKKITLKDNYHNIPNTPCYDSIVLVPLLLLDNAIKYTVPQYDIRVKFNIELNVTG